RVRRDAACRGTLVTRTGGGLPVTLRIAPAKDGAVRLAGRRVTAEELRASLRRRCEPSPETPPAVLQVDGATPHGDVIRLIDIVKQSGISEISLRTERLRPR